MKIHLPTKLLVLLIFLLAGMFRLWGVNWDQNHHLHPDERFLTMVGIAMKEPATFAEYLNPATSKFNPTNIGYPFYVYGTLPIVLTKLTVDSFNTTSYDMFTITGRILTAIADLLILLLVYKIMRLFEKHYKLPKQIALWAMVAYALSVLPIQLSHFFAVDLYLTLFLFASLYGMLKFTFEQQNRFLLFSAVAFGCAVSCKITALIFFTLLIILFYHAVIHEHMRRPFRFKALYRPFAMLCLYGIVVYITLRVADPYLFQSPNFFDLHPNTTWMANLQTLKAWSNPEAWYPPGVQWLHKTPVLFSLQNIALFGLGLPLFFCMLVGIVRIIKHYHRTFLFLFVLWATAFFIYQSVQNVKSLRYFIMLYPFFAMFAGIGFYTLTKSLRKGFVALALVILCIWPLMFISIYTKTNSRVAATEWIYNNLPADSVILTEQWDDALPLRIDHPNKTFTITEMTVFDPDTTEKWMKIDSLLQTGDYLILSSNRGWGSIPTAPERYPQMSKFYEDLFNNKLQYKMMKTFTSYPSLEYLGIPLTIQDDIAEEAFTVFDHPKVIIFQKQ